VLSPVRPSVCRSEVRIIQLSAQSSPMTSFHMVNFTTKFQREHRERGRRMREW